MDGIHPNWLAYFALILWPLVGLCLYSRFPLGKATLWTILGGFLLLPVGTEIKIASAVPVLDKNSIPSLTALLYCTFSVGRLPKFFRGFGLPEILIIVLLVSPFVTSMLNADPIQVGQTFLPGVGTYDAGSASLAEFIFILPFFLGRQFLRSPEDNLEILRVLVIAGLAYSLPMLFEIRMSPQLHQWIYGYYPTDFIQEIRDGGFRPMVLLGHGLLVAFFAMTATVAATALWRTQTRTARLNPGAVTGYLAVVLLLCKTAGALIYGALLVPLVRWARPRLQLRVASFLVLIALTYPLLRTMDLIPTTSILDLAQHVSANREASLKTRFDNEGQLLDRAWQRPWFGWGRYGRSRVYNGWNGADSSITDGHWIITVGQFGIVGFIAEFGLLGFGTFRAAASLRYATTKWEGEYLATLALIVAINIIDLLPNSSIRPWTWLLVGALLGRAETLQASARQRSPLGSFNVPAVEVQDSRRSLI